MKVCEEHGGRQYDIAICYCANGGYHEGDYPICEEIKEKDKEIDNLKQQIDTLEDQIANLQ